MNLLNKMINMKLKILKKEFDSAYNKKIPYIILMKHNGKNVVYKFEGTLGEDREKPKYFQEYASKIFTMLKVNSPKASVVSIESVIKNLKKIRSLLKPKEIICYTSILEYLENNIKGKALKIQFLDAKDLQDTLGSGITDYAIRLAGRIICGEYLLGIEDRHARNYMVSKTNLKINAVWSIDLEESRNTSEEFNTYFDSSLYTYSTVSFIKTKRLYDDIAFIQGFHDVQKMIKEKKTKIINLSYMYAKFLPDKFILTLQRKIKFILKTKPIELALNLRMDRLYWDLDEDYIFKKNTSTKLKQEKKQK